EGLVRELREELGGAAMLNPLGSIHAVPIRFDRNIPMLVSLGFLVEYCSGVITPSDDISGAEIDWVSIDNILQRDDIEVPNDLNHFRSALRLYRTVQADHGRN
ncbi:MAG: NUDIX hydrolase, partial [Pseudomonadota bacterium]